MHSSTANTSFARPPQQNQHTTDLAQLLIQTYTRCPEESWLQEQLQQATFIDDLYPKARLMAGHWIDCARSDQSSKTGFETFTQQWCLSHEEGLALLHLAEICLRTPDHHNLDALIENQLTSINCPKQSRNDPSIITRTVSCGLWATGKLLEQGNPWHHSRIIQYMTQRLGRPAIRRAVQFAMRWLHKQLICGQDIYGAIESARSLSTNPCYSPISESALTADDSERYFLACQQTIAALAKVVDPDKSPQKNPGISLKLSALHPRFTCNQAHHCIPALTQKLLALTMQAHESGIPLTVDAEEADRTDLMLTICKEVWLDPRLHTYSGFGLTIQAYQKGAPAIIDWLGMLAHQHQHILSIRLVKGAYWHHEIEFTQVKGLNDYPVYTRKAATDMSYLICAKKLSHLSAWIYPQFATHHALSIAMISQLMGDRPYEFQRLYGMGDTLYRQVAHEPELASRICRVYAPVDIDGHLLPYLTKQKFENQTNTAFVDPTLDHYIDKHTLLTNPVEQLRRYPSLANDQIPLPRNLGLDFPLSAGLDLSDPRTVETFEKRINDMTFAINIATCITATPINGLSNQPAINPATGETIGVLQWATPSIVEQAIRDAQDAWLAWDQQGTKHRARLLQQAADRIENTFGDWMAILIVETGKTWEAAITEVRNTIDLLRRHAQQAHASPQPNLLAKPHGEAKVGRRYHGLGVIACLSTWHTPMTGFLDQVAAALVTGNAVIANPAHQTVLCAAKLVHLLHDIGIPRAMLQLVIGNNNQVESTLISHEDIGGVMVTGPTSAIGSVQKKLANRRKPTTTAMTKIDTWQVVIVDSTANLHQAVREVIDTAFCLTDSWLSACHVIYLQRDIADRFLTMLRGAMAELTLGDPRQRAHDISPMIDRYTRQTLVEHLSACETMGTVLARVNEGQEPNRGYFFAPALVEIDHIHRLQGEIFGPILHVIRHHNPDLDLIIADLEKLTSPLKLKLYTHLTNQAQTIAQRLHSAHVSIHHNMKTQIRV